MNDEKPTEKTSADRPKYTFQDSEERENRKRGLPRPITPLNVPSLSGNAPSRSMRGPDWSVWGQMIELQLWECVLLSLDLDPRDELNTEESVFEERLAIAASRLSYDLTPVSLDPTSLGHSSVQLPAFASWAISRGWKLPNHLAEIGRAASIKVQNNPPRASLGTKERQSLLKLVIGMAKGGYKFDPNVSRSSTIAEITADLQEAGVALDEDTVRRYLREAADLLLNSSDK